MVDDAKRDELRAKIEAGEQRNAQRSVADYARDATNSATEFVKEHPITAVAGVAVIGLAIGAMTRPGRRVARQAGARASSLASVAAELGLAYASGMMDAAGDAARTGRDKLEDLGDGVAHSARSAKRSAAHLAGDGADNVRFLGRKAARQAGRSLRSAKSRLGR